MKNLQRIRRASNFALVSLHMFELLQTAQHADQHTGLSTASPLIALLTLGSTQSESVGRTQDADKAGHLNGAAGACVETSGNP